MSKLSRLLLAVAGVLLGGMFVFPIWRIGLIAPQYPEGLGMLIRVDGVGGLAPTDLDNINELNHYIGMKVIDPGAIPELKLMPWLVGALVAVAFVAAAWGNRRVAWTWVGGLVAFGVAGIADFWRWMYDYGHNLDFEHAIIKVTGMTYSPPIIGSKQLLNFTATSWPWIGAWCAGAALALGVFALVFVTRPVGKTADDVARQSPAGARLAAARS